MDTLRLVIIVAAVLLFVVGLPGLVLFGLWLQRKTATAWRRVASELGFDYGEDSDFHTRYPLRLFLCGRRGSRVTSNILRGQIRGMTTVVATFGYQDSSMGDTVTFCLLQDPALDLPKFSIHSPSQLTPRTYFGTALDAGVTYERPRVEFTEDAVFSESLVLRSPDEERTRQLMTPDRRAFFLDMKENVADFVVDANGDLLLFFRRKAMLAPETEKCQELIAMTLSVLDELRR